MWKWSHIYVYIEFFLQRLEKIKCRSTQIAWKLLENPPLLLFAQSCWCCQPGTAAGSRACQSAVPTQKCPKQLQKCCSSLQLPDSPLAPQNSYCKTETQNMTTWVLESHAHWAPHTAGFTDKTQRRAFDLLNPTPRDPSNRLHLFGASVRDQTKPQWLINQTCDINRCNSVMCWGNKVILYPWRNHALERCAKVITDNQQITKHFDGDNMHMVFVIWIIVAYSLPRHVFRRIRRNKEETDKIFKEALPILASSVLPWILLNYVGLTIRLSAL